MIYDHANRVDMILLKFFPRRIIEEKFPSAMRGWSNDVDYPTCGSDLPEIIVHYAPEFTEPLTNDTAKHFEDDLLNLTCGVVGKNHEKNQSVSVVVS